MTGRLLTAREVADRWRHSPETILRWRRQGKLPTWCWTRLPSGAIRFREDGIERCEEEWATTERGVVTHPAGRRPAGNLTAVTHPTSEED
jgi:predicted site-specific integrase-resolvase